MINESNDLAVGVILGVVGTWTFCGLVFLALVACGAQHQRERPVHRAMRAEHDAWERAAEALGMDGDGRLRPRRPPPPPASPPKRKAPEKHDHN